MGPAHEMRPRVLVADADADVTETLSLLLELNGYDVRAANDGETALAIATQWHPHAVVMDLVLPRRSGLDVAKSLRSSRSPTPPVLLAVTGVCAPAIRRQATQVFDRLLVKPADIDAVLAVLGRAAPPGLPWTSTSFQLPHGSRDAAALSRTTHFGGST